MKYFLAGIGLLLSPLFARGQDMDSLAVVHKVDSLIQVSRALTAKQQFDKALEVNANAEKLALERFGQESSPYASCCFNHGRVLNFQKSHTEAEKWYLLARNIREKVLGKEHLDYAWSQNNLGLLYRDIGNFEKAEPLLLEAKAIREKVLGKEHPDYAGSLNNLVGMYFMMGQYAKAEPLSLEALATLEKTVGKEHPAYTSVLNNLAGLYLNSGQYAKAESVMLEILAILEKTVGKEDPNYTSYLANLAIVYFRTSQYTKAEPLFLEATATWEKTGDEEHPGYAVLLYNLADLYLTTGNYNKAEPLFHQALAIQEKILGKMHPDYASSRNDLAALYLKMGYYGKAEPLLLEVLSIRGNILGKEHPDYAASLNNLGVLYEDMGRYEEAEPVFLTTKAIREKTLGKKHREYMASLNNLATLYLKMGNYSEAERLFLEAKTIVEETVGKEHFDYVAPLINLATLYRNTDSFDKAEDLSLEAKVVLEKTGGKEHPSYALNLDALATIYRHLGNYNKAEQLHLEAKAIQEKILGKAHPDYAANLYDLANLYSYMGAYEKSEKTHLECMAIREKLFGREHPDYALNLMDLSIIYEYQGRFSKSEPLLDALFKSDQSRLSRSVSFLSERELGNYTTTFQFNGNTLSSFLLSRRAGQQGILTELCYDHALFQKGFLLTAANRLNTLPASSPEAEALSRQIKGYRRRLAVELSKPIAERKDVVQLEGVADSLEKMLAHTVAGYAEVIRQATWKEVQADLQKDEAAIEFIHFKVNFTEKPDSILYAALVLLPGAKQPIFVPLFEEKQLDSLLLSSGERRADYVNGLYTLAERGAKPLGKPQKTLYDLLWKPLESNLQGVKTIYFSPSGLLHRLNVGAISIDEGEMLADRYRLVEMGSTRQLAFGRATDTVRQLVENAWLIGGVQYDMDSTAISTANVDFPQDATTSRGDVQFTYVDSTNRVGTWSYLKWTEKEATALELILKKNGIQTETRKGYAATEESFKAIGKGRPSPRILHFATHGFFFPDPKTNTASSKERRGTESAFKMSEHPMIRSGLLLAGANYAWQTGKLLHEDMEDGILTAYEISQMNLSNTELVVLSACETGLGDIQGNEGVYGLQRAFKIAGAKYLVMSLWQVPDQETAVFMAAFYRHWLEGTMRIPEAFHATQKEMRERFINPYQWAGFVLVE